MDVRSPYPTPHTLHPTPYPHRLPVRCLQRQAARLIGPELRRQRFEGIAVGVGAVPRGGVGVEAPEAAAAVGGVDLLVGPGGPGPAEMLEGGEVVGHRAGASLRLRDGAELAD